MTTSQANTGVQYEVSPTWKKVLGGVLLGLGMITFFGAEYTMGEPKFL